MEVNSRVMERILYYLRDADEKLGWKGKFNYSWRKKISQGCTDVPFSVLRRAFEIRYGAITKEDNQPAHLNTSTHVSNNENNSPLQLDTMDEDNSSPDLDHDAIKEILRRVPLPSLLRAKSICKGWNTTILSANFNLTNNTDHFVIQQSCHTIAFFCASLNQWFPIPLPWNKNTWDCHNRFKLCAAADGLFLFTDSFFNPVIFNLLTNHHRFLPRPTNRMDLRATELIVHVSHFEIISIDFFNSVQHYDSSTDEWKNIPMAFRKRSPNTHYWKSTLYNGMAYFTNNFGRHLEFYDIERQEFQFKEIKGGLPPQIDYHERQINFYANLPSLLACNGKLILVGRLQKVAGEGGRIWGGFPFIEHALVGIWELDSRAEHNESWSLISVIPRDLLEDTIKSSHGTDFMVAASSDKIWLTIKGSTNLLTFNLGSMEWSVLPGCADDLVDCVPRRAVYAPFKLSSSLCLSTNPPEPVE